MHEAVCEGQAPGRGESASSSQSSKRSSSISTGMSSKRFMKDKRQKNTGAQLSTQTSIRSSKPTMHPKSDREGTAA